MAVRVGNWICAFGWRFVEYSCRHTKSSCIGTVSLPGLTCGLSICRKELWISKVFLDSHRLFAGLDLWGEDTALPCAKATSWCALGPLSKWLSFSSGPATSSPRLFPRIRWLRLNFLVCHQIIVIVTRPNWSN